MFVIFYPVLSHFISKERGSQLSLGPMSLQLVELMTVSVHMSFGSQRWLLNWRATYIPLVARAKCTTSFISPYTSFISTIEKALFISALQSFIPYYIDTGFRTLSRSFFLDVASHCMHLVLPMGQYS